MRSVLLKHSYQVTSLTQSLSCALGLLQRAAGLCVCLTEGGVTQSRSEGQTADRMEHAFQLHSHKIRRLVCRRGLVFVIWNVTAVKLSENSISCL